MNIRSAYSFRTINVTGAIIAAAMIAAACGSDEEPAVAPVVPAETTTTITEASVTVPVQDESPSTTTTAGAETSEPEPEPVQDDAPNLDVEPVAEPTDEPEPASTTVPPAAEPVDEPTSSMDVPKATEPEDGPEPEPGDSSEPDPPDASVDPPADTPEPVEPVETDTGPEPGPAPTTTLPESEPEPEPEAEPAPEPEPEPTPEPVLAEDDPWARVWYEPVLAAELWPEGDGEGLYPDDLFCQVLDEATFPNGENCWYASEPAPEPEPEPEQGIASVPPEAGMVPAVHADVPPTEWQRGPVNPEGRAYDKPRATEGVQTWRDWCYARWHSCKWLEHEMYQALDYLGASEKCVLNAYTKRAEYFLKHGSGADASYAKNNYGWHVCATVIDPIEKDTGRKLSDRPGGITLAERCRIVLTTHFPGIQLEAHATIGGIEDGIAPTRFGQDCDAWATYITESGPATSAPACNASMSLAEEWMEHNHDQHENYFAPHC